MNTGNWMMVIGHAVYLFVESIPDALWLTYYWLRDWQSLVGGLLLILAAQIFSQGSLRAARIRATGMIRAAQIAAGTTPIGEFRNAPVSGTPPNETSQPSISPQDQFVQKLEQLRSLIRSAMSTLTSDTGKADTSPNFYVRKIANFSLDQDQLIAGLTPDARDLHAKLLAQLTEVSQAVERNVTHAELSQALVQLNARAREFAAAIAATPAATTARLDRNKTALRQ